MGYDIVDSAGYGVDKAPVAVEYLQTHLFSLLCVCKAAPVVAGQREVACYAHGVNRSEMIAVQVVAKYLVADEVKHFPPVAVSAWIGADDGVVFAGTASAAVEGADATAAICVEGDKLTFVRYKQSVADNSGYVAVAEHGGVGYFGMDEHLQPSFAGVGGIDQ